MHKIMGHRQHGSPFGGGSHRKQVDKFGGIATKKAHHYADGGMVPGPDSSGRADRKGRGGKDKKGKGQHVTVNVMQHPHPPPTGGGGLPPPPVPPTPPAGGGPPGPGGGGANPMAGMAAQMPGGMGMPGMGGNLASMMGGAGGQPNPKALAALAGAGGLGAGVGGRKRGGRANFKHGGRAKQGRSDKADDGRKPRQLADHLHNGHGPDTGWVHGKDKGAMTKGRDHWEKYASGKKSGSARNLDKGEIGPKVDLYAKGGPIKGGITGGAGAQSGVGRLAEDHYYRRKGHRT